MDQQWFILRRQKLAQAINLQSLVIVLANEVRDHFDIVKVEYLSGCFLQVIRDCCDTVRLHNPVTRDRQVRSISADECDVGSVQRRHDRASSAWFWWLSRRNTGG